MIFNIISPDYPVKKNIKSHDYSLREQTSQLR